MLLSNSLIPVVEGHLPTKKIELAAGNIIFNFRSFLFDIFVDTENKNMVSIVLKNVHVHGQIKIVFLKSGTQQKGIGLLSLVPVHLLVGEQRRSYDARWAV